MHQLGFQQESNAELHPFESLYFEKQIIIGEEVTGAIHRKHQLYRDIKHKAGVTILLCNSSLKYRFPIGGGMYFSSICSNTTYKQEYLHTMLYIIK